MTRTEPVRFNLRMQAGTQVGMFLALLCTSVVTIAGAGICIEGLQAGKYGQAIFGLCLAGMLGAVALGGALALKLKDNAGYLEVGPDGIVVDTYISIGRVPWANLHEIAIVTVNTTDTVGICVKDIATYIASRKNLTGVMISELGQYNALMRVLYTGSSKAFAPILKPFTIIGYILGKQYVPKSGDEADLMASNKDWYGYHILIPTYWFSDAREVVTCIDRHRKG